MNTTALKVILDGLMNRYRERVPDVNRVLGIMQDAGLINSYADVENDHIAFRTMGVPQLGIRSFEKIFLHHGYERRDSYHFEGKKLDAYWYSPPAPDLPRIFVSELRVNDLSREAKDIVLSYTNEVTSDPVESLDLNDGSAVDEFLHRSLWRTPTLADFRRLSDESEYASWVIYNRYYLNHFTISVHNLPPSHNTVESFNTLLESHGIVLNESGGKAKTSQDGLLIQSATVAAMVEASFSDGDGGQVTHQIPGSYVEFAERRVLPSCLDVPASELHREHRRDGFETANADRIFESTYSTQTSKQQ